MGNNPRAFPVLEPGEQGFADVPTKNPVQHLGMTLRDYFAAAALQGLLANNYIQREAVKGGGDNCDIHKFNAIAAYEAADEMLKLIDKEAKP